MVSEARYQRALRQQAAYDRLPPLLRQTLREAFWEYHDACELATFASMRHNRPEVLAEQVKAVDATKLAAAEIECIARGLKPTETPVTRALKRRSRVMDPATARAAADRAMATASPNPASATTEATTPPSAPPGAVPFLVRLRRLTLGE
jgi:hypothetical protein